MPIDSPVRTSSFAEGDKPCRHSLKIMSLSAPKSSRLLFRSTFQMDE